MPQKKKALPFSPRSSPVSLSSFRPAVGTRVIPPRAHYSSAKRGTSRPHQFRPRAAQAAGEVGAQRRVSVSSPHFPASFLPAPPLSLPLIPSLPPVRFADGRQASVSFPHTAVLLARPTPCGGGSAAGGGGEALLIPSPRRGGVYLFPERSPPCKAYPSRAVPPSHTERPAVFAPPPYPLPAALPRGGGRGEGRERMNIDQTKNFARTVSPPHTEPAARPLCGRAAGECIFPPPSASFRSLHIMLQP